MLKITELNSKTKNMRQTFVARTNTIRSVPTALSNDFYLKGHFNLILNHPLVLGVHSLIIQNCKSTVTLNGVILGTGGVTLDGEDTVLIINNLCAYTGETKVIEGTIIIGLSNAGNLPLGKLIIGEKGTVIIKNASSDRCLVGPFIGDFQTI